MTRPMALREQLFRLYRPFRNRLRWMASNALSTQHLEAALIEREGVTHEYIEAEKTVLPRSLTGPATMIVRRETD